MVVKQALQNYSEHHISHIYTNKYMYNKAHKKQHVASE